MYVFLALTALLISHDYDSLINELAGDRETALVSHASLKKAGTAAFPALLARIHDETIIDSGLFQGEVVKKSGEGELVLARPTIGLVAFEMIQNQIESTWPKGTRKHYALNKQNVELWLRKHKGLSITQLRIRAAVDSMDALSREIETDGITESRIEIFSFLRDRLSKVLDDAMQWQIALDIADEPSIQQLDVGAEWEEITNDVPKRERPNWSFRIFRHSKNQDLLTIARSKVPHKRSFDDTMEFAPGGYPFWIPEDKEYIVNRVKTERTERFKFSGAPVDTIEYAFVNEIRGEDPEKTIMGQGYSLVMRENAYYVQHTSTRAISHWTVELIVDRLLKGVNK